MASIKITDLPEIDTLADADLIEVVDDVGGTPTSKKSTWTEIKSFLKSYFDGIYAESGVNSDITSMTGLDDDGIPVAKVDKAVSANANIGDNKLVRGDGGAEGVQECSTITVSDNGEMVNTGQPCFNVVLTSDQDNVTGDDTLYSITGAIWTEIIDQGNNFSNGTYTAPVDGQHQLSGVVSIAGLLAAHSFGEIRLETSNRSYMLFYGDPYTLQDGNWKILINFSLTVDMDESDTAYLTVKIYNGTKVIDVDHETRFTGALIC